MVPRLLTIGQLKYPVIVILPADNLVIALIRWPVRLHHRLRSRSFFLQGDHVQGVRTSHSYQDLERNISRKQKKYFLLSRLASSVHFSSDLTLSLTMHLQRPESEPRTPTMVMAQSSWEANLLLLIPGGRERYTSKGQFDIFALLL